MSALANLTRLPLALPLHSVASVLSEVPFRDPLTAHPRCPTSPCTRLRTAARPCEFSCLCPRIRRRDAVLSRRVQPRLVPLVALPCAAHSSHAARVPKNCLPELTWHPPP